MYLCKQITNAPYQIQTFVLPDNSQLYVEMRFVPLQYGWFFQKLVYKDFEIEQMRICTSPNMLFQYRNLLPFGLACITTDSGEPKLQDDFLSKYAQLYILTAEEVDAYSAFL